MNKRKQKAFTLIELLVTLAVIAILAAVGVPAMGDLIRRNEISSQTMELASGLMAARSEAIRRGATIDVEPLSGSWSNGMVAKQGGSVLRQVDFDGNVSISSAVSKLSFSNEGTLEGTTAKVEFALSHSDCSANPVRRVRVMPSGAVSVEKVNDC